MFANTNLIMVKLIPFIMKIFSSKFIILVISFLIFSIHSVFGVSSSKDNEFIWKANKNVFFKYAEQDSSIFGLNDHPVELKADELKEALEFLKFPDEDNTASNKQTTSIFTVQQIKLLSEYLAKGLIKAKPNRDIIFALEKNDRGLFGLRTERFFLAGRAFYKDKKLNIIIGDYNRARDEGFEAAYDPTHVGIVSYNFNYGSRTTSSKGFKKAIIKVQGIENKQLNGVLRADWLVMDPNLASNTSSLKTEAQNEGTRQSRPLTEPIPASIEERLTILNNLKAKGLITEEEYTTKRTQILEDL